MHQVTCEVAGPLPAPPVPVPTNILVQVDSSQRWSLSQFVAVVETINERVCWDVSTPTFSR